jgi:hypothetical protein
LFVKWRSHGRTGKGHADRVLEYEARFIEAVEEGRAPARTVELLEHEEVVNRIERMLRS